MTAPNASINVSGIARTLPASPRCVNVAVVGATGRVGSRVLELLATREEAVAATGVRLRLIAVANSRAWAIDARGLAPDQALRVLGVGATSGTAEFAHAVARAAARPLIVLDCTASAEVAAHYPQWLAAGIDVVTPNKHGPSADALLAAAIVAAQRVQGARVYDATTVGAQLPLLSTLRELHRAGDRIERFEAVLSGTLSFVLAHVQQGAALSASVRDAVASGYAEPHPARDLSGEDAARKLVILLRAIGEDIEFADIERVPLVEASYLSDADPAVALRRLESADETWRARAALAQVRQHRWIYRASFDRDGSYGAGSKRGRARVAPECVPLDHPLANLAPCENALLLHSAFYAAAPLRISGPGAGIDLTATGVFGDLLNAAQRYAAPAARLVAQDLLAEEVEAAA